MSDVHLICEECNGNKFKKEIIEVKFANKNISEILDLTVSRTFYFLKKIMKKKYL